MQGCVGGSHVNLMEKLGDRSSGLGIAQSISTWVGHPLLGSPGRFGTRIPISQKSSSSLHIKLLAQKKKSDTSVSGGMARRFTMLARPFDSTLNSFVLHTACLAEISS